MNEVLSELLRVLARDWKTLKDGMLDYHLMKAVDMADELERERDEANKELNQQLAQYDALFDEAEKIRIERDEAKHSKGITFLMAEKHALENELEAMTAKAIGWQKQAELDAKLLVECREKAERYRLEANAMMAQRNEAQRKVSELQAGLDDIEEYGTEEINAAVDLRHQLAAALVERSKAREALKRITECDMRWSKKIARDALEAAK